MCVINIFSGTFCGDEEVAQGVAARLKYDLVRDEDLIGGAARESGLTAEALRRAMFGRPSIFNKFSHERERAVAFLRMEVARVLERENLVLPGYASQLIPRRISHSLDICLIAATRRRMIRAVREMGLSEKEALARIHGDDEAAFRWVEYIHDRGPWDPENYDLRLVVDDLQAAEAVDLICENAASPILAPTEESRGMVGDFQLTSGVWARLIEHGHNPPNFEVSTEKGAVTILINKKVIMLGSLSEELEKLARSVERVDRVEVKPGPDYYRADVYRQADFQLRSKVLLVDDEQEFVQTLSERLLFRNIGSAVVYDGEEALRVIVDDEPEVIVLDLKMPGLDGIEVLKHIKTDHPKVEVIILTGHGSEKDRETCMSLGAFDYLEKPVDIDKLSETMRRAYDKVRSG